MADDFSLKFAQFSLRNSQRDRHRLYRKLQGLLEMNEPLPRCLERLWVNTSDYGKKPKRTMPVLLKHWLAKLRMGETFAVSLEGSLPQRDLMLIRAGEESGTLSNALSSIMVIDESASKMRGAISKAITYPLFLTFLLFAILWMFGINLVEPLRASAPPAVFQSVAGFAAVTDFVRNYGLILIATLGAIIFVIVITMPILTSELRVKLDRFPPWSWYRIAQGSSFLLGMAALLKAQVSLRRSLEILNENGSAWWHERLEATQREVMRGRNLGEALRVTELEFPDKEIAMDLELLAERADVAAVLQIIVREWLSDQIRALDMQANLFRTVGMAVVGAIVAWAFLSIVGLTTAMSNGGFK